MPSSRSVPGGSMSPATSGSPLPRAGATAAQRRRAPPATAPPRRDELGRNVLPQGPLRKAGVVHWPLLVHPHPIRLHGRAAHHLRDPGGHEVVGPGEDALRREVHRLLRRPPFAIQGHRWHLRGPAGRQHRLPPHIPALLPRGDCAAPDHVLNPRRVHPRPARERLEDARRQVHRVPARQRAPSRPRPKGERTTSTMTARRSAIPAQRQRHRLRPHLHYEKVRHRQELSDLGELRRGQ